MQHPFLAIKKFLFLVLFLFLACLFSSCEDKSLQRKGAKSAPVRLVTPTVQDVPTVIEAIGNVEAYSSVSVKSQVGGQILEAPIVSGQEVSKDEVLFRLDQRPFDAAVAEAAARLARDKALLSKAQLDLSRHATMLRQEAISRDTYEQVVTAEKTAQANVQEAEASLQVAALHKEYSVIRAPISGKLGNIFVRTGNVIKANDDRTLVVINSIRPAEVRFTVAERYLATVLQSMQDKELKVSVLPEGDDRSFIAGRITAVDNEINRTTGSIQLHALFPNEDERLWPGQFVRVSLVINMRKNAVLVPERTIQEGLTGKFVYIATPTADAGVYIVQPQQVKTEQGPDEFVVITEGLAPHDSVVADGQLGLAPGFLARDMGIENRTTEQ